MKTMQRPVRYGKTELVDSYTLGYASHKRTYKFFTRLNRDTGRVEWVVRRCFDLTDEVDVQVCVRGSRKQAVEFMEDHQKGIEAQGRDDS